MDWTATILAAGSAKAPKGFSLDGIDLMPILTSKKNVRERTIFWRTFQRVKQKAIREGNWKYLQDDKGEYLFDLAADQGEKNDLKATQPAIFERLKRKFAKWETTVLKPIPL